MGKAVPEIKKNSDKLLSWDVHIENFNDFIQDANKRIKFSEINGVLEQHQDDIKLITYELESLKKSMSIADTNHPESVEKNC